MNSNVQPGARAARGMVVTVSTHSPKLVVALSAHARRVRKMALPIFLVGLVGISLRLREVLRGPHDPATAAVVVFTTMALIGGVAVLLLHLQNRRALCVPGRIWMSRLALYVGPHDEGGLPGAVDFARRHAAHTEEPFQSTVIVRLVLSDTHMLVVPTDGPNTPLACPLETLERVEVVIAGHRDGGVTLNTRDGKEASFAFKPDRELVAELHRLGAQIKNG